MSKHSDILKQYWGYDSFRPLQEEIIGHVLSGKNCLAILPTGGGKSICFQVPALMIDGLCLVVSPLIALMKDQVENLKRKGITAFAIHSGMNRKEVINTLEVASNSNCKFLYVSPERLESTLFKEYLHALKIKLIAVDEAHCISQWGYDFRPAYLRISEIRNELPEANIIALTASATHEVQQDICDKLKFREYKIFRQSFERPNLSYSVFKVDSKINKLIEILENVGGSSIVYCSTRKHVKKILDLLQMHNISADLYHAGLSQAERSNCQKNWIRNKTRVIVCTNAFGMGIDKPDVRTVVHVDIPECLEYYYQESGRAGRDNRKAYAVLLYHEQELDELQKLPEIHFPPKDSIKKIYSALMNYLQLPSGSGEQMYYDFNFSDFIEKFPFDPIIVLNTLKILDQEEILGYDEQVYIPSKVQFICNKERLYEFESSNPDMKNIIKTLLRTYEGIFDFPASIQEGLLARLISEPVDVIQKRLLHLHAAGIIGYIPKKENAQLYFFENRVSAEFLHLDEKRIKTRKEKYTERLRTMLRYVKLEENKCRSQYIATYFGDRETKRCECCDHCLKLKNPKLSVEEFKHIHESLINALQEPLHANMLMEKLGGIKKDKAWKVIDYLVAENKIEVDKDGWISQK